MKILAVDPSVNRIGWALIEGLYQDADDVWHDEKANWSWGTWDLACDTLEFKLYEVVEYVQMTCGGLEPTDLFVCEWPGYFDALRGHIAAKQGYTINLAAICAYVAGYFQLQRCNWFPVPPHQWKGNVSKEITRRRFFREMGIKQIYSVDHNAVDAVMMLLDFCRKKKITMKIISRVMDYLPVQEEG